MRFNPVADSDKRFGESLMKSPSKRRRVTRRVKFTIDVLTTIGIFVAVGVVIWRNWPTPTPPPIPLPVEPLALDDAPTKGSPAASIVVLLYSDFECPYCGSFARDTLGTVDRLYVATGKVRLAYRYTAPPSHPRALPSAIAAECARRQGRFWEMHDKLFADQTKLDDTSLGAYAGVLGLDAVAFESCQTDPATADRVARDASGARSLRIGGTPAFFIGTVQPDGRIRVTRTLRGAVSLGEFQQALDRELGDGTFAWLNPLRHPRVVVAATVGGAGFVGLAWWIRHRRRIFDKDGPARVAETVGD